LNELRFNSNDDSVSFEVKTTLSVRVNRMLL